MQTRSLWIVAESKSAALNRAYEIDAGRVPMLACYTSEEAAKAWAAELARTHHNRALAVHAIILETRTTDDGRIRVARIIDAIGELAAAALIVIGGAWLTGLATLL